MKICPVCQAQLSDDVAVCPCCNTAFETNCQPQEQPAPAPQPAAAPVAPQTPVPPQAPAPQPGHYAPPYPPYPPYPVYQPYVDPSDHTAEFDREDIAQNKLFAMLCYLLGILGVAVAALCAKDSPFVQFHMRQELKIAICQALLLIAGVVLFFTFIVPIAAGICTIVLEVINLICFFRVGGNKAKEAPIVQSFSFLK